MELARHEGREPLQLGTIAERQGIPLKYLRQIMTLVTRSGYVRTIRGAGGGFVLARSPAGISLSELYSLLEGPIEFNKTGDEPEGVILELWKEMAESLEELLVNRSLQDLVDRQEELERSGRGTMYYI